jgi:hypothetical protein
MKWVVGGTDSQPPTEGAHHDSGQFGILAAIDHPFDVATGIGDLPGFQGDRRLVRAIGGYLGEVNDAHQHTVYGNFDNGSNDPTHVIIKNIESRLSAQFACPSIMEYCCKSL